MKKDFPGSGAPESRIRANEDRQHPFHTENPLGRLARPGAAPGKTMTGGRIGFTAGWDSHAVAKITAGIARRQFLGEQGTIADTDQQVSAIGAALANGFAVNALEVDDGQRMIKGHPGFPIAAAFVESVLSADRTRKLQKRIWGFENVPRPTSSLSYGPEPKLLPIKFRAGR